MSSPSRRVDVLLVEDDADDARLTEEALRETDAPVRLVVERDGRTALARLEAALAAGSGLPDLILLDLNLPGADGREILTRLKAHARLRRIPLVILTTSDADTDVSECYDLGANCYLTKPLDFGEFRRLVRSVREFWLERARLPAV